MTGETIIEQFRSLVDDETLDSTLEYQLLNLAKNEVEDDRVWNFLNKRDISNTAQTKLTAMTLPSDTRKVVRLIMSNSTVPHDIVPFIDRERFENYQRKFFVDWANSKFYICGSLSEARTAILYYQMTTDDVVAATSPIWPSRFHSLISFKMAILYYAIDAGEKTRAWDDRWTAFYNNLYKKMIDWDVQNSIGEVENEMNAEDGVTVEDSIKNYTS